MQTYKKSLSLHRLLSNMMKKQVLLFVAALLMLASCNQQQTFNINVNLANADGQTVYLQKAGQTLDSAVIRPMPTDKRFIYKKRAKRLIQQ